MKIETRLVYVGVGAAEQEVRINADDFDPKIHRDEPALSARAKEQVLQDAADATIKAANAKPRRKRATRVKDKDDK